MLPDADLDAFLAMTITGQDEIARLLMKDLSNGVYRDISDSDFIAAAVRSIQRQTQHYADLLADSAMASYLSSQARLAQSLKQLELRPVETSGGWRGNAAWMPVVQEAVNDLASRQVFSRSSYDRLDAETRSRAFTVANTKSLKTIAAIRDTVKQAVAEGKGFHTWRNRVKNEFADTFLSLAHSENVYRTTIAKSMNQGVAKLLDDPIVGDAFPFVENLYTPDTRLSELCFAVSRSGLDGTAIFLRDDPVWREYAPPRHWMCRCRASYLTVKQAASRGIRFAQEWLNTGIRPSHGGWVPRPRVSLPKGWTPSTLL